MDVESLAKQLILQNMTPEQQTAVLDSIRASVTQAKDVQKQRIGENVKVVVEALKKIEADIKSRYDETGKAIEKRVASIKDGKDGRNGVDGKAGRDGRSGADGATGPRGADGLNGRDGRDGEDGISVTDAHIDFDGSLIIHLSTGRVINVGEVVAPDLVEKIKVITNGGGTSQQVLDTLASLQTQINNLIPSQTGNAGKYLTTNGSVLSWDNVAGGLDYQGTWNASTNTPTLASGVGTNGYYYITATAGSTNLDGITDWQIGDWLLFNGTVWQKIDQSNLVTSVAGRTGAITLTTADVGGLGTIATQAANNVSITGGSITGITDLAVADGGTGASNVSDARTNLGLVIGTDVLSPTGSAASLTSFPTFNQNTTGSAATLTTGRTISVTGDLAYTSPSFDGSTNVTAAGTLATVNANVGSFTAANITVNAKGLITAASSGSSGGVTSVTGTSPVLSSGGTTPNISLASGYGDTLNPYASKTANFVLAAPNGSAGVPAFRAVVAADIPTLNQSTTGSAATLTTGRTIAITGDLAYTSPSFNGSGNVTAAGTLATVNANVGSFTNASVTVNAKGLVTAVSNGIAGGTVTSVAATVPAFLSITGSPVTTSGTLAIGLSGTALPIANGGTAATSASAARTSLGLAIGTDVLAPNGSAASLTSFPTLNQNTTGSAATVTGNATGSTFGFNSGYGSVATAYGCRAWVNFNGTGTVAIRASGNVSSITDNGTGDYTVNFTTAMPDADYGVALGSTSTASSCNYPVQIRSDGAIGANTATTKSTTALRLRVAQANGTAQGDSADVNVVIFR